MENITTAEVMDKFDMFQSRFGKIDQFGWWDLERISADAGTQFTSTVFKNECQTRRVRLRLAAPEHQEMNGQVEVNCRIQHRLCADRLLIDWVRTQDILFDAVVYPRRFPETLFCAW